MEALEIKYQIGPTGKDGVILSSKEGSSTQTKDNSENGNSRKGSQKTSSDTKSESVAECNSDICEICGIITMLLGYLPIVGSFILFLIGVIGLLFTEGFALALFMLFGGLILFYGIPIFCEYLIIEATKANKRPLGLVGFVGGYWFIVMFITSIIDQPTEPLAPFVTSIFGLMDICFWITSFTTILTSLIWLYIVSKD